MKLGRVSGAAAALMTTTIILVLKQRINRSCWRRSRTRIRLQQQPKMSTRCLANRRSLSHVLAARVWTPNSATSTTITLTSRGTSARIASDIGQQEEIWGMFLLVQERGRANTLMLNKDKHSFLMLSSTEEMILVMRQFPRVKIAHQAVLHPPLWSLPLPFLQLSTRIRTRISTSWEVQEETK